MALAGGVTIKNFSKKGYIYKEGMIFSKDGKCSPFDSNASGTIGSEGAGVVVLKRLNDAIRDRDNIYAIIKGSAINNDGKNKVGYTAPSVQGQLDVIKKAHKMARIEPNSISFIEAHGTATELGDPIEIEALNVAFDGCNPNSCCVGSVKSNMGHLDSAAGVAGFIKAVLAIKNKQIPATLNFIKPNPKINFENGPFYVNNSLIDLKNYTNPIRAGVSSFGIGGTNVHVVLEEAPIIESSDNGRKYQLIVLSAKTKTSLQKNTVRLIEYFGKNNNVKLPDIAYSLKIGRERFKYRKFLICENKGQAVDILHSNESIEYESTNLHENTQNIIFMFPGQGAQYIGMCKDLYLNEKAFKEKVDECIAITKLYSRKNFHSILFPEEGNSSDSDINIDNTQHAQPLLFIIEYSLANLFIRWGIKPHYMIGHSIGEYVAACISGVFTLNDALKLVIRRGELMSKAEKGSMLSINISKEQLMPLISDYNRIDLAAINSATSLVVSGKKIDINEFEQHITKLGYQAKKIQTSHAFHSYMMDVILNKFEQEVSLIKINEPKIPYVSNITGELVTHDQIKQSSYWSEHLRNTVLFLKGTETLLNKGDATIVEIGPGKTLSNYVSESSLKKERHHLINTIRHPKQVVNDQKYLVEKLGHLWLRGINIDWNSYYSEEKRSRVSLPTYSFDQIPYTTDFDINKLIESQIKNPQKIDKNIENFIHVSNWQQAISPNNATELVENKFVFLIFCDKGGFSDFLAKYLILLGQKVIEIKHGKIFKKIENDLFELNHLEPDELIELWKHLDQSGIIVNNIIYCTALNNDSVTIRYEDIEEKLNAGYLGLSYLSKSIAETKQAQKLNLTVINNHLANVTEEDKVDPLKTTIHGPAKIIPLEVINVKCKVINIPYPFQNDAELNDYLPKLINEMFYESDNPYVAYRLKERWVPSFQSFKENEKLKSGIKIVNNGTYIITGGFGGMGFTIANNLVHQHEANVIIVYRSYFPERRDWDNWLSTKGTEDSISIKIQQVLKMESTGCNINLYQMDLSVEEQVKYFMLDIKSKNLKINGLIWAAGEVDFGGIILNRTKKDFTKYISSKVHGLLLFDKYIELKALDFIALFSSVGNVLYQAKFGQVAYNAANEFRKFSLLHQ